MQVMTRAEFREYVLGRPPTYYRTGIRLHHTANEGQSGAEGWQGVENYHLNTLGWSVDGYHVGIDNAGVIYVFKLADMEGKANHIGNGYNVEELAVSLAGNFSIQYPSAELADTLKFVCEVIAERYEVDKHPGFHRDVDATACPGYNLTHELINGWLDGGALVPQPAPAPSVDATGPGAPDLNPEIILTAPVPPFHFRLGSGDCLGEGDIAEEVRPLEICLNRLGKYPADWINTLIYMSDDKDAVVSFQADHLNEFPVDSRKADGVYGPYTASILQRALDAEYNARHVSPVKPITPQVQTEYYRVVVDGVQKYSFSTLERAKAQADSMFAAHAGVSIVVTSSVSGAVLYTPLVNPTNPEPVPPVIIPLLPNETPTPLPDETKTMLQKILALLEQLVAWLKQIFNIK